MSLYAVKNEDDKLFVVRSNDNAYLYQDQNGNLGRTLYRYYSRKDAQRAIERAGHVNQCHVVLLVDKPQPVVVTQEEAEMLEWAKKKDAPSWIISTNSANADEDRIMRAYVNGYTVEKPKRYLIKVPHTDDSYFYKIDDEYCNAGDSYHLEGMTDKKWFTAAEIDHYGLQDCERIEVKDND